MIKACIKCGVCDTMTDDVCPDCAKQSEEELFCLGMCPKPLDVSCQTFRKTHEPFPFCSPTEMRAR